MADGRWIEVSKSAFAHEADGLQILRDIVPEASPYRAWTNFEFMDNHGGWNEIDALILGRRRLHMVELKAYTGVLSGDERNWILTGPSRKSRTQRSALLTTRHKAQKLASRLKEEVRKVCLDNGIQTAPVMKQFPFIQEAVYFHGDSFAVHLSDLAKSNLFGIDGREEMTNLPGIAGRLLEPPREGAEPFSEAMSVILALALKNLGAMRRKERDAGSWTIIGSVLDSGEDWQEFEVQHKATGERGRGRVVTTSRGALEQARAAAHRRIQREYTLIRSLHQESIVPPSDLAQDDGGNTVLIYPENAGFAALDLALAPSTRTLNVDQQIEVLRQVSDALAYAHRNQVCNRGLAPSSVLINTELLDDTGEIQIRLADWSWAGRIHASTSATSTLLGSQIAAKTSDDDVYQAPEDRWSLDADRIAVDIFSLGALAYFLIAGKAPARNRGELITRLQQEQGLDLAAAGGQFVDEDLRSLVLQATNPRVTERIKADKSGKPKFGAAEFRTALDEYLADRTGTTEAELDPLNSIPGATLMGGRFTVEQVLGAGSTARGLLVADHLHDDEQRVLKVGLDDAATERLYDEAEVLAKLGEHEPAVPGVVRILESPLQIGQRTALLLTNCGHQTLSDLVRHTAVSEARLRTWGTELLDTVVALDGIGIAHRDIKPSNLGMLETNGRGSKKNTSLALFDFSLSRAGVTDIAAGTPPYRDPFLGLGTRAAFDSAAERYAAAVVLYEMATASTPIYGDGRSDPGVITDDVTLDVSELTDAGLSQVRALALVDFFRTALARDARRRHDTATAMRDAWVQVFRAKSADSSTTVPTEPATASRSRRGAPQLVDAADDTAAVSAPLYSSTHHLIQDLKTLAGKRPNVMRRQVLELILGSHANSPADPFVTYADLAARVQVTPGRIAQIFGEFDTLLNSDGDFRTVRRIDATLEALHQRALTLLIVAGGASTPDLLARDLVSEMTNDTENPQRAAVGLLRLVLACARRYGADEGPAMEMVRRRGAETVAMIATGDVPRALPAKLAQVAEELSTEAAEQGTVLVPLSAAGPRLRKQASLMFGRDTNTLEISDSTLVHVAAAASPAVALTSQDELHAADLSIREALALILQGVSANDSFDRSALDSRLKARFPNLQTSLPKRPKLDEVVTEIVPEVVWDESRFRYRFPAATGSQGSTIQTRQTLSTGATSGRASNDDIWSVLNAGERRFRALGVPLGHSDEVAAAVSARFGATVINVTDVLLTAMRQRAADVDLDWTMILAADAGAAADREGLKGFVAQAAPAVIDAVENTSGPVVLTDLSTLSAYGQLGIVSRWTDLTSPPPYSVWAMVPQSGAAGGATPLVDGVTLPLNSPEQFVPLTEQDVFALRAAEADMPT